VESQAQNATDRGTEDNIILLSKLLCGLNVEVVHGDIRKVMIEAGEENA